MESHPSKRARNTESNHELQQKYDALVQRLDSINQSRKLRTISRSFTDSTGIVKALAELQDSPRSLMHSLQGPLRKYDLALYTPLRERRAAIESGRLKCRRLFDRQEDRDHVITEETEVRSVFSYDSDDENENDDDKETMLLCPHNCHHCCFPSSSSSNSSSVCDECLKREVHGVELQEEEEMLVEKIQEKDEKLSAKTVKEKRWTMVIMLWLAIGVLVFAIGFVSVRCFVGYSQVREIILVPT